jgi:uncharacterized protein DUF3168
MAEGTALQQIQTAAYNALANDSTMQELVTGVFDVSNVPENQAFPYITVGNQATETQTDTFDTRGYDDTFVIDIWTQTRGFQQARAILARMNQLLHRQPLTMSTQSHIGTWYLSAVELEDPDGITQHVTPRYRMFNQESL